MRNNLYQRGFAEYMTAAALKNISAEELSPQLDTAFVPVAEPEVLSKVELNRLRVFPPSPWWYMYMGEADC